MTMERRKALIEKYQAQADKAHEKYWADESVKNFNAYNDLCDVVSALKIKTELTKLAKEARDRHNAAWVAKELVQLAKDYGLLGSDEE